MTSLKILVLDSGPLIENSTLPKAEKYITTPNVLAELKDESVRSRLTTFYNLECRLPTKESLVFVRNFAKKTGDAEVLSATDLGILALTYELDVAQNKGDWRLRNAPGQKEPNGPCPNEELSMEALTIAPEPEPEAEASGSTETPDLTNDESASDSDDEGWITPSNIDAHKAAAAQANEKTSSNTRPMEVACATHDFAMQNVLLQIGLDLISAEGRRVSQVKSWILRCHACFKTTRRMDLKFCPSCGGPTLLRTSVSTTANGEMKVNLKRNMQWKIRGTVYPIPKQLSGTANMKGRENLILRADQREVEKFEKRNRKKKTKDLLDPDFIPSIVSGRRATEETSYKIGYGRRNPNSNKK